MGLKEFSKREPIRDPNWRFKTGQYAGETISDVLYCNPGYIQHLMEKTDFDVHADLFEGAEERYHEGMKALFEQERVLDINPNTGEAFE